MKRYFLLCGLFFLIPAAGFAASTNLTPKWTSEGPFTTNVVQGRTVWVATNKLYFDVPVLSWFTSGVPVYVQIEYLDTGSGRLSTEYDSDFGDTLEDKFRDCEVHTRSARINSGAFVYSYQMFENPRFAGRCNGNDFRINLSGNGVAFCVAGVTLSSAPFDNETFQRAISRPWLLPNPGPVKELVDNQTLVGKVMTGYQGWFRTPTDIEDGGWRHWGRSSAVDPTPSEITIDMWPYLNDYRADQIYPAGQMVLTNGRPAYLFSSADLETVQRHFRWMRKYNIDGAYLQRFVSRNSSGYYGKPEFVLDNVRKAAASEGRIWAIEYDVSSLDNDANPLEVMTNDWNFLTNNCGILDDPRYAHEDGKPVLFIWGFSVTDRDFTIAEANSIVDYFAAQGLYLIGGVGSNWEGLTSWHDHYKKYDQLLAWMETSGSDLTRQKNLLASWGMKILPHAWPGFSWHNLKRLTFQDPSYKDRNGGRFYWTNLYNAVNCGADQIFLGMFDEYDEGTAIMPMNSDHPNIFVSATNTWGHYLSNGDLDPFWYLRLSGAAHEMLNGQRTKTATLPTESNLFAVSYAGEDNTSFLGFTNVLDRLTHPQGGDGNTAGAIVGDKECRINLNATNDFYFYFNIDDTLCYASTNGQKVTIEIDYYGNTNAAQFRLQYDSLAAAYSNHPALVTAPTNSKSWKSARWTVTNGYFGNRQNNGADFRIALSTNKTSAIRRVSLFFPEEQGGASSDENPPVEFSGSGLVWSSLFDATGWRLKTAASLMSTNWQEISGPLVFTNGTVRRENLFTNSAGFYRLERPARQ
jgi:hypothetical protein